MPIATSRINGFRTWMRKTPQPSKLRCGDTVIKVGLGPSRWTDAEQSVAALNPTTVEALDVNGEVLRIIPLREETAEERQADLPQKEEWPQSEQAQLAMIITASNDRAASRHENAYRMAFDSLKVMYDGLLVRYEEGLRRNAQLEATILKMRQPVIYQEQDDDGTNSMVAQVLQAALSNPALLGVVGNVVNGHAKTEKGD